ncbi:csn2 [Symbiodinium sp. CCMP2456]|nr:csn2 [Symbiodinium sp. CCMP2456]
MSDSDEFEYESDDDPYGGQEEEDGDEEAIQIENTFYEADDNKQNYPEQALEQFQRVVTLEAARGSEVVWRFKALQNIVILCARIGRFEEMATRYRELLSYMDQVTRNDASEAINTVLDSVSSASDLTKLETIYELTLDALKATANQRLWFSTSVKLAKLHLEMGDVQKLQRLVKALHRTCQKPDGTDDVSKGSHLLEVYALEIQMCTLTKNSVRMKEIYPKTINLTSAIADPRNIAVIRESGGKMFMSEKKWEAAYNEFFEAFKNYQETGNASRAKTMLKYVVLANMLALSSINPFDSREAKVYQDDPEISAMASLRTAYEQNDIGTIDQLLTNPSYRILSDTFIRTYLQDLLRNIRLQVLQNIIKPYRCVSLDFLAKEINVANEEVVSLLVQLILDEKIAARIDGIEGFLQVSSGRGEKAKQFTGLQKWVDSFERIHSSLHTKLNQMQHG